jgi:hypothetical protein
MEKDEKGCCPWCGQRGSYLGVLFVRTPAVFAIGQGGECSSDKGYRVARYWCDQCEEEFREDR